MEIDHQSENNGDEGEASELPINSVRVIHLYKRALQIQQDLELLRDMPTTVHSEDPIYQAKISLRGSLENRILTTVTLYLVNPQDVKSRPEGEVGCYKDIGDGLIAVDPPAEDMEESVPNDLNTVNESMGNSQTTKNGRDEHAWPDFKDGDGLIEIDPPINTSSNSNICIDNSSECCMSFDCILSIDRSSDFALFVDKSTNCVVALHGSSGCNIPVNRPFDCNIPVDIASGGIVSSDGSFVIPIYRFSSRVDRGISVDMDSEDTVSADGSSACSMPVDIVSDGIVSSDKSFNKPVDRSTDSSMPVDIASDGIVSSNKSFNKPVDRSTDSSMPVDIASDGIVSSDKSFNKPVDRSTDSSMPVDIASDGIVSSDKSFNKPVDRSTDSSMPVDIVSDGIVSSDKSFNKPVDRSTDSSMPVDIASDGIVSSDKSFNKPVDRSTDSSMPVDIVSDDIVSSDKSFNKPVDIASDGIVSFENSGSNDKSSPTQSEEGSSGYPSSDTTDYPSSDDFEADISSTSSTLASESSSAEELPERPASPQSELFSIFYPRMDPNHKLADPSKMPTCSTSEGGKDSADNPPVPLEMNVPIWKGTLSMKRTTTDVEVYLISGSIHVATACFLSSSDHTTIQINQKTPIDEDMFERRYIKNDSQAVTLIALPSKECNCNYNNMQPIQNFFAGQKVSGAVICDNINIPKVTYVVNFFPKLSFTSRYIRKLDPLLALRLYQESYLVIIIEPM